jgi:hypothetical protein
MIGLERGEIEWVRLLVKLLRHPDPLTPELARQALEYVDGVESRDSAERQTGSARKLSPPG